MNDEKKKNKLIAIGVGICAAIILIATSTYAYWTITKSQEDSNNIVAACLDINMESVDGTFALDPAWPISDSEGMQLEGYTFTVTNNCEEDVNYVIGMDSLEVSGVEYLDYNNIKISIDNNESIIYGEQEDIDHIEADDTYTIRDSKKLYTAEVTGKVGDAPGKNTHNVKVWISSESPVEEQSKVFSGRMFITGGQNIANDKSLKTATAESCFTMNGNEIVGYNKDDAKCTDNVVIPATVNSVAVKTIDSNAFKTTTTVYNYDYGIVIQDENPVAAIIYNMEEYDNLMAWAERNNMSHLTFYEVEEPELEDGQSIHYCEDPVDGQMPNCLPKESLELTSEVYQVAVSSLDLSLATNLEKIEASAFSNVPSDEMTLSNYTTYNKGLTSLTFGLNSNPIDLGHNAFARADLKDLELYASSYSSQDINQDDGNMPFGSANIENLTIVGISGYTEMGKVTITDSIASVPTPINGSIINNLVLNNVTTYYPVNFRDTSVGTLTIPTTVNLETSRLGLGTFDKVILAKGISDIPEDAFSSIEMNEMILPSSIRTIGKYAFNHSNVSKINLPEGLISIGEYAFQYTNNLTSITIPSSVTNIGYHAFFDSDPAPKKTITMSGRADLTGMTLGAEWYNANNATLVFTES